MTEPNEQDIPLFPDYSKPLKQAFDGRYESCFVIFNPFIRYPAEFQAKFTITTQAERLLMHEKLTRQESEEWENSLVEPTRLEEYYHGSPVTWKEVAECYNLNYPNQVNDLFNFQFLLPEFQLENQAAQERFTAELYKEKLKAWLPSDGDFEPLLCPAYRRAFLKSNAMHLTAFEFEYEKITISREEMEADPDSIIKFIYDRCMNQGRIHPDNNEFQFVVEMDFHCHLFYGAKDFVRNIVEEYSLEGFYCDDTTTINWTSEQTEEEYQKYVASQQDQPSKQGKKARFLLHALLSIVLLSDILFIIGGVTEYITLGIQADPEEIAKYPFGAEGPVAGLWSYENPTNYVKSALLLMVLGGYHLLLTLFTFFRSSNRLTISIIALGLLNWFIPNFDQTIWSILDHLFPTLYPLLIFG